MSDFDLEELVNLREMSRTLFEESSDALFLFDPETEQLLDANPMAQRLSGFTQQQLLRLTVSYLFRSEKQGGMAGLRGAFKKTGFFHSKGDYLLRHQKEHVWVPVNLSVSRIHVQPKTLGLVVARDMTEQREARWLLETKEAEHRRLMASVSDCLWSAQLDAWGGWTYRYISPVVEKITGRPPEFFQAGPDRWKSIVHAPDQPRWERMLDWLRHNASIREEYRIIRPDGNLRWVRDSVTVTSEGGGRLRRLDGVLTDIHEQRTLETHLRQAQKLQAIEQLAGGLAHDFNNMLTAILGNLGLLLADMPESDPHRTLTESTRQAALRAAELVNRLVSFSRQTVLRMAPVNLAECLKEVVQLLRGVLDPAIRVEVRTESELWLVQADANQMNQMLMNLCLNARDAMPTGGRLILATANVELGPEATALNPDAQPGEYVRLTVEDTGHGMTPEVREHIFEPFFTTKEPTKGTGLGLAMVLGIVKKHEGWITCSSEVGRGTRFEIFLPRWKE
jgi:two-component system, cell cycle sensor histidine kinase and response regulator CckA